MEKITRIHLAKIPYEIGVTAEIKLNKYLEEIRDQLDANLADEIMADIEQRITELLAERKIKRNDVITTKDIDAIQKQLGSPEQFNEQETTGEQRTSNPSETKKLLRDSEDAYLGGVASGLGAYFGIDPIFFRVIFIVLTFASGFGILLYIFLWLLMPEAKSSSDKLQMSGQPVTVANLGKYRAQIEKKLGDKPNAFQKASLNALRVIAKLLKIAVSIFGGLAILYILAALGIGSSFTFVNPFKTLFDSYRLDYLALGLMWVIGVVIIGLITMFILRVWGKRSQQLKYGALSLISVLILTIAGSAAVGLLEYNHFSNEYGNGKANEAIAINNVSPKVAPTKLVVKSDSNLDITYVITNQNIHATYVALPGLYKPSFTITNSNGMLSVDSNNLSQASPNCLGNLCKHIYLPVKVTLYGPEVSSIADNNGAQLTVEGANVGNTLNVDAFNYSVVNINDSYAATMNISALSNSTVQANNTSSQQSNINVDDTSSVTAPAATDISATIPNDCSQSNSIVLFLESYSGQVKINGQIQTNDELNQNSCVSNDNNYPPMPPEPKDGGVHLHRSVEVIN